MTETSNTGPIEIRSRWDNSVLFTSQTAKSTAEALAEAVAARANLAGANLAGANLAGANLAGANLDGASLAGANLDGANLAGANLDGAYLDDEKEKFVGIAMVQFTGHGERGRTLTAIKGATTIRLLCGCFAGTVDELRAYIEKGDKRLQKTRTLALDTVLMLLDAKNEDLS